MLTVGSLFSGIGGFDLGLERTGGFRTAWFCEQDPFCRRVLAKHWPGVPCHGDVRGLREPEPVDVLCGGFPCQDLSVAGRGAGIDGPRSGLWAEYARLVGELRPRYVLVENVPALLARGLGRVLGDLAALGYDAEWDCIPASAVGAPHRRDRIWVVAYPQRPGLEGHGPLAGQPQVAEPWDGCPYCAPDERCGPCAGVERSIAVSRAWWGSEPDVGRVAHGVPRRVDRLRALGNAVVPQVAEWIGRRVLERELTHGS